MTSNDIRSSFLRYFAERGHQIVPSSSLVPTNDPTLLFTNAGMNQFKDVFLGRERRTYSRAATSQRVMRVSGKHNDLDNVGPSLHHHTFFEMLGNFSFGDYFKKEAIQFAWEVLTDLWKIPADHLVVSVFKGSQDIPRDSEAYEIWRTHVRAERILELGTDDNFWQMGDTGPCGRCSEIHLVREGTLDPEIEIWNNVFMEFERSSDGTLRPLPAPSIDTGMGLERITAILQKRQSNYDTDLFGPLLDRVAEIAGVTYGSNADTDISMRVVADHCRSTTFLIADGVIPSNEWRGYVLRKIMRRAMRHGKRLGITEPFLHEFVAVLVRHMGHAYPELQKNQAMIEQTIVAEEKRFEAVLVDGLPRLEAEIAKALETPARVMSGDAAFRLYDTFGVPFNFIEDTAATQDVRVDREGYDRAMDAQRQKARAQSAFGERSREEAFALGDEGALRSVGDRFEGYATTSVSGIPVLALFDGARRSVETLAAGSAGYIVLPQTPFYLEAGGQVSDSGRIVNDATGASASVEGMVRVGPGLPRAHRVRVAEGTLHVRDIVRAEVDDDARAAARRNHTATHLLHAALRQVLGAHVKQAGSLVAPDRLRFDFVHFHPVTREQIDRIERLVTEQILRNVVVETRVRPTQEAIAEGAMALFGEKYGDMVRVVSVADFSRELCGGTHVTATGDIGSFVILAEGGVAAGVRRIEAVTGLGALAWLQQLRRFREDILEVLKVGDPQALDLIERLQADAKRLAREVAQMKAKLAVGGSDSQSAPETVEVAGVRLARRKVEGLDKEALRSLADSLKASIKSGVVVIASAGDGKVQVVVAVTPDVAGKIKAGQIVKEIAPLVGGSGGGRPDFAEAGGKQPDKIDDLLRAVPQVIEKLLSAR